MSTGLECSLRWVAEHEWYYLLERGIVNSGGDLVGDGVDDAYGPFKTEDEALDHLDRHHANPGGMWVDDRITPPYTQAEADLFASATY